MVTNCEFCAFYVYDDDGYAECDVNLDEDEMARFLGSSYQSCPYYQTDDEYKIVRKHPSGCFFVWVIMKNTVNVVFSENLILYLAKDARQSRLTTIIVLVATTLAGVGYYLYYAELGRLQVHDTNEDFLYLFCLFQSLLFIYLLLVTGISHFIKVK